MKDQTIYFQSGQSFALGRNSFVSAKQAFAAYLKKIIYVKENFLAFF